MSKKKSKSSKKKKNKTSKSVSWTQEEEILLFELKRVGIGYNTIAGILGRSYSSCEKKYRSTQWKEREFFDEENYCVKEIYASEYAEKISLAIEQVENDFDGNIYDKRRPWSKKEELDLFYMRTMGHNYKQIATHLNRSIKSCSSKYETTDWTQKSFYDPDTGIITNDEKMKYLNRKADLREKRVREEVVKAEIIADRIAMGTPTLPNVPLSVYNKNFKKKGRKTKNSPEEVGLVIGDTHIGLDVKLSETGGLAEYNLKIFKERVEILKKAVAEIVELHSSLYRLPVLNIFCLGDMVAGMRDVGAWNPNYINLSIQEQFIEAEDALASMIYYWLGLFEKIRFYGVYGNHGRIAKKGIQKEDDNWDLISYRYLQRRLGNNDRVEFIIPNSWFINTVIKNHRFFIIHGDNMRGHTWPARSLEQCQSKLMTMLDAIPNYTIAGHYHSIATLSNNNGRVFINGSFMGGDMYSLKDLLKTSKPEQIIFGIHAKRGITWQYNIDLSYKRTSNK